MNTLRSLARFLVVALMLGIAQQETVGGPSADLVSPQKRQATVRVAEQITRVRHVVAVPSDLLDPFSPAGFDGTIVGAIKDPHDSANAARVAPVPPSDREILEALVHRFPAGGAMMHGEKMVLTVGYKHYELGQVLTLSYDGHEYDVEIVGITASRFTLRYRDTELTRSIQLSK